MDVLFPKSSFTLRYIPVSPTSVPYKLIVRFVEKVGLVSEKVEEVLTHCYVYTAMVKSKYKDEVQVNDLVYLNFTKNLEGKHAILVLSHRDLKKEL